jgi:hypothetical protein
LTSLTLFLSSPLTILYVINEKKDDLDYDKEKYKEMILHAAETVLGYFGFDRTPYGDK